MGKQMTSIVEELHYVPNSLARSLRAQRSNLIAVIVGDNADAYFAEITRGVEEIANEYGYLTIVCNTDREPEKELHYLQILGDYRVDGIIFAGSGLNEVGHPEQVGKVVQAMRERGAAVVTLAQHTLHVPSVQADNFGGARAVTTRLLELGHQRIAFITGPSNALVANARLQGYMAALVEAGAAIDPALILPGRFDRASGEQAVQSLLRLSKKQRPSAIFASNDETAFGVLSELGSAGWSIPRDISVCGFGDLPMARVVVPALTTVYMGIRELGRIGAYKMLAQLNHEDVEELEIIPTSVIERGTTAKHE